jgi:amidase
MATWEAKGAAKRQALLEAIPAEWRLTHIPSPKEQPNVTGDYIRQFLNPEEISVTEPSAEEILANTTTGKWKAATVIKAFSHRAALAHQLTNCLHEIFFEDGFRQAEELDAYLAEHGKPKGPLHGLPVSLKDSLNVKGYDTTTGIVGLIGKPAEQDSELVKHLRSLGAVLYCKTAVPQASFAAETENHIIGYTLLAQNRLLSSGGSSGGEGPLIALRGSVVGIGSDIGGSIRHPAALNGLYGLKPSFRRLPIRGVTRVMEGQDQVPFSMGPLSSSASGLTLIMKSILQQQPWLIDPRVVEIPWRDDIYQEFLKATKGGKQLTFGIMRDDGFVRPQPPVNRGLDILVKKVQGLGHKVVEWNPPSHAEAMKLSLATWAFDGSVDVFNNLALSGEPIVPSVAAIFGTEPRKPYTAEQIAETSIVIWKYREKYEDYWNSNPVDAVIAPTYPHAGIIPGKLRYGYTFYGNILDYSVGVIPVTTVDKSVDVRIQGYDALNERDKMVATEYDPELQHGAPIGISIYGRRFEDEKILGILEALSSSNVGAGIQSGPTSHL